MNFSLNSPLIFDALGWAVLHSLWQGALAAVLVWGVRSVTREHAADTRYMFGFLTLCALLTAFIGTFFYTYNLGASAVALGTDSAPVISLTHTDAIAAAGNPLMRLTEYTNYIGALWALCFAVLGARSLSAYRLTHKLRTTGLSDLPSNWQNRFTALSHRSGVTNAVRGYISEHVASPITFGFFKPIVLVPAWFFTGLSTEQCEAILLHEFAHIRRHDYVTNIVQIIIKTVFFYHPAIAYICKSINEDREHACDDFAARICKNPEGLATALGTIRIKSARSAGVFALSADAPDTPLMHRLKRLVGAPSKSPRSGSSQNMAAAIMAIAVCAAVLSLGVSDSFAHPQKPEGVLAGGIDNHADDKNISIGNARIDLGDKQHTESITVHGKTYTFGTNGNGKRPYTISSPDGERITINGKKYLGHYEYKIFSKDGENYVVKEKNGKRYIEIDDSWHKVNRDQNMNVNISHRINNKRTEQDTPATPQTPTAIPKRVYLDLNQRIELNVQNAVEAALRAEGTALNMEETQRALEHEKHKEKLKKKRKHASKQSAQDKQRAEYQKMRARLLPLLKSDGYLPKQSSKVTIDMMNKDIFINGKQLPNAKETKYCKIVSKYIPSKSNTKRIVIKPGYLHVSIDDRYGKTNYTYNEN